MTPRMTAERVPAQQRGIGQHDRRADADAELTLTKERREALPPETHQQHARAVERVAVKILNEEQRRFPAIPPRRTAHRTRRRTQPERLVVRTTVVVAGQTK